MTPILGNNVAEIKLLQFLSGFPTKGGTPACFLLIVFNNSQRYADLPDEFQLVSLSFTCTGCLIIHDTPVLCGQNSSD